MAKKIMEEGARIDKSRAAIAQAIDACKRQEKLLTKQGVQIGKIHFKPDRKTPTMFVYEPVKDGRRQYVYVGTDQKKQADMRARVERWEKRDQLQKEIERLEKSLIELDRRTEYLAMSARRLEKSAEAIREGRIKRET